MTLQRLLLWTPDDHSPFWMEIRSNCPDLCDFLGIHGDHSTADLETSLLPGRHKVFTSRTKPSRCDPAAGNRTLLWNEHKETKSFFTVFLNEQQCTILACPTKPGSYMSLANPTLYRHAFHLLMILILLMAQLVKNPPAIRETWVRSLGWEAPLEKGKATHSSILAWTIPWTV